MSRPSRENPKVREFLLRHIEEHPHDAGSLAAKQFGLSRTAISRYMHRLVADGLVTASGNTNARKYELKVLEEFATSVPITANISESDVWAKFIEPRLVGVKSNIAGLCQYGFTEIFNNVIDHSASKDAFISYRQTYTKIAIQVEDHGIGIFKKIQDDFNLPDSRTALLELSKGKLTSDSRRHSGEGIFFTSRMFDDFYILSGDLCYRREKKDDEWGWLVETDELANTTKGTEVTMSISTDAAWTTQQVFDKFSSDVNDDGAPLFVKTHVHLGLGKYGSEQLVSRSQAKRILARVEKFRDVVLDFAGVATIGQAFADEIFRVYQKQHPAIRIVPLGTTPEIDRVIRHVTDPNNIPNSP